MSAARRSARSGHENTQALTVAVIIPFYQREPGILERALRSIVGQRVGAGISFDIVIVDDQSPSPPGEDIRKVVLPDHCRITLLRQSNGGPGSARNRALAGIRSKRPHAVAFLDSDDEWRPDHIRSALEALSTGASLYFCDHTRGADGPGVMQDSSFFIRWTNDQLGWSPEALPGSAHLYRVGADRAFELFWDEYLSQTSTVVFRPAAYGEVSFRPELKSAGEDHYLWLQLAQHSTGVAFSNRAAVICGTGVNVYFSALDWDESATAARIGYRYLFFRAVDRGFRVSNAMRRSAASRAGRLIRLYAFLLVRNLSRGTLPDRHVLREIFKSSPLGALLIPVFAVSAAINPNRHELEP